MWLFPKNIYFFELMLVFVGRNRLDHFKIKSLSHQLRGLDEFQILNNVFHFLLFVLDIDWKLSSEVHNEVKNFQEVFEKQCVLLIGKLWAFDARKQRWSRYFFLKNYWLVELLKKIEEFIGKIFEFFQLHYLIQSHLDFLIVIWVLSEELSGEYFVD